MPAFFHMDIFAYSFVFLPPNRFARGAVDCLKAYHTLHEKQSGKSFKIPLILTNRDKKRLTKPLV